MGRARRRRGSATSGKTVDAAELKAFVKAQAGSVKTPKQIEVWPDLPRSQIGKVVKAEIKAILARASEG